jgi:hypothetical protein
MTPEQIERLAGELERRSLIDEQATALARAAIAAAEAGGPDWAAPPRPGALALDARALRGIPAIGRASMGGAIPGTRPDQAVLRLDRRRRSSDAER